MVRKPEEALPKTAAALMKAYEWGDRIPLGVFFQNEFVSTFQERISQRIADYLKNPPAKQVIVDGKGKPVTSIRKLLEELKVT